MTRTSQMPGQAIHRARPGSSAAFWVLSVLLVICFAFGGSARGDVASLMVLRPLTVLALGFALWHLEFAQIAAHRFLFGLGLALVALPLLHLIPLPPAVWIQLPGRGLVADIDASAGLGGLWRPLSLAPDATGNALFAVLVPISVLLLGVQLDPRERFRLVPIVLFMGGLSALFGLLQILGDTSGPLYFYDVTNEGSAVGLFANRNHQALLLAMLFPMLALLARGRRTPVRLMALLAGLVLVPLILITGSRAGLVAAAIAIGSVPLLMGEGRRDISAGEGAGLRQQPRSPRSRWLIPGLGGLALVALTIALGRGEAWQRLVEGSSQPDGRLQILPTLLAMAVSYAPFGSGIGSFEPLFQVNEPDGLLSPTYMNHAHNDWLELVITGGVPAALLALVVLAAWVLRARTAFLRSNPASATVPVARLGLVILLLAGLASLVDYPLRVPAMAALGALAVLWAACPLAQNPSISDV